MTAFLFRVDAGPGIGLGHLQRCLALAERLTGRGGTCAWLVPSLAEVRARIEAAGGVAESLDLSPGAAGGPDDLARVLACAGMHGARTVVVDSYAVGAAYLAGLRAAGLRVVLIDDLAREPLPADIVVNGGAQAGALSYRAAAPGTRFLLGPTYALLRSEFSGAPHRRAPAEVAHVLVTVGGDDPHELTAWLITALDHAAGEFVVRALVGPFAQGTAKIEAAGDQSRRAVTVLRASTRLRELMSEADVAISAAGQTVYELAACGTPTIAFAVADNQTPSLHALSEAGVVLSAGLASDAGFGGRLMTMFDALRLDAPERLRLSLAARQLVDGCGADRVAAAILEAA